MKNTNLIYGVNPVREAIRAGSVDMVYVSPSRKKGLKDLFASAEAAGVEVRVMNDAGFFDSNFPKGHQCIAASRVEVASASVKNAVKTVDELLSQRTDDRLALYIVLDQIEDPRNLGAILRTAEAAGAAGVVTQERRSARLSPEAVKASAGASEHIPLVVVTNIKNALRQMQDEGITIAGAEAVPEAVPVWDADLVLPLALVVGSEGQGLRRTVREMCDVLVSLPLRGKVSSLNASVACGAIIFEILRQNR